MTQLQLEDWANLSALKASPDSVVNASSPIASLLAALNRHQVGAALFTLRPPLSRGFILDDEFVLAKTIEAGINFAHRSAERCRHILLFVPTILYKQWQQELLEKFYLPMIVLDYMFYGQAKKNGSSGRSCDSAEEARQL